MTCYSIEPRTRIYVNWHWVFSFTRNLSDRHEKKLLDTATETGLDATKTASKRVIHKTTEATRGLIRNKITEKSC